ncbi:MAG TPA: hypothetical protein VKA34_17950 [Balneolales bacterium]|nr:hypothetical protein [Balneolales bacterium]
MKDLNISENNFNRLAIAIMQNYNCSYKKALELLGSFKLKIVCGEEIRESPSLQAGLLTAINCGKRAFHGGVDVNLPDQNIPLCIKWNTEGKSLNDIIVAMGGILTNKKPTNKDYVLSFGIKPYNDNSLQVISSGWRSGVISLNDPVAIDKNFDFELAGIAGASLGVAKLFLKISGIDITALDKSNGISLWRTNKDWRKSKYDGPRVNYLPKNIWILGLGHLGQAYIWSLSFLYRESKPSILLQDYDTIEEANYGAGLLLDNDDEGSRKTRKTAEWLEKRQFPVTITERKFDENTKRTLEEPYIALCGFDSASSRKYLENAGFDLVVEAGLGGELSDFDNIHIHTFPSTNYKASNIWSNIDEQSSIHHEVVEKEFVNDNVCGILGQTLSNKAISTSFIGAFTSSLVLAELVKSLNDGIKSDFIGLKIRSLNHKSIIGDNRYNTQATRNGFIEV